MIPGVSRKINCVLFTFSIPRISSFVVCTLEEIIEIFFFKSVFIKVDFPELGKPVIDI